MPAGRKKLPTALKKDRGTYRPDREIESEMMPSRLMFAPSPPEILDERAVLEWQSSCAELASMEMLHRTDLSLLAAYCSEMSSFWEAVEQIKLNGDTYSGWDRDGNRWIRVSPYVAIKNGALKNAQAIAVQFGFTPAARTKIAAPPPDRGGSFEEMMNMNDDD